MPTLKEMLQLICQASAERGIPFGDQCALEMEVIIRKTWPAERVYIAPATSQKSAGRADAIRKAAERLPTGVVAERYGVTRRYVGMLVQKRK